MKYTNDHGMSLPMSVWLVQNGYSSGADVAPEGELISATTLLKPTKQLILSRRIEETAKEMDISSLVASRMGHALHDSIERAWTTNYAREMRKLGYNEKLINNIQLNPKDGEQLGPDDIPIYLERRFFRPHSDVVITGQSDFIINGQLNDFKSTSVFSYLSGSKDEDYKLQGSIYKWLSGGLITSDTIRIQFIFTDWQSFRAKASTDYPQFRAIEHEVGLLEEDETTAWIDDKLEHIRKNANLSQDKMTRCTDVELWKRPDTFKFYLNPETAKKKGRATRNFDTETEAVTYQQVEKGGRGVIVKIPGVVNHCPYCPAYEICEQRKEYYDDE